MPRKNADSPDCELESGYAVPQRETHAPPIQLIAFFSAGGIWRNACNGQVMILPITPQSKGPEFAAALFAATSQETHWAQNLQEAGTRLREQTYSAAIIDQFLLETDPEESDQVLEHLGTAFPVYVNFALTGMDRLLREVRSALHRRKREEATAFRAVAEQMQSEMRETLTVMLLSCELAMAIPNVPSPAAEKIRTIDTLARELRLRLEVN